MKYKIALILGLFAVAPMQITQAQDVLNVVDSVTTNMLQHNIGLNHITL